MPCLSCLDNNALNVFILPISSFLITVSNVLNGCDNGARLPKHPVFVSPEFAFGKGYLLFVVLSDLFGMSAGSYCLVFVFLRLYNGL